MRRCRPLSVALLTSASAWRGSGVSFANIACGLAAHGHRPHLLAGEPEVVEAFTALGLPVTRVLTDNTGLRQAFTLHRVLSSIRADLLMVDRPRDLRLGALASLGQPITIVNRYNLSRTHPPPDLLSRLAYRRVKLTIFVSETLARRTLAFAPYLRRPPYRIIPEGVDPDHFRPDPVGANAFRVDHGLGNQHFVLAVGSLTAEKRYDFLLEGMARLGSAAPPLVICGDGPLAQPLRERARELRVDARFLGLVPSSVLPAAYTAATCLAHACAVETFGLSILEAMACGAAVLAVRGGAVAEVLGDTGVLAPSENPAVFAELLSALLANDAGRKALGTAARERALARFPLAQMRRSYVEAIESVAARRGPASAAADGDR